MTFEKLTTIFAYFGCWLKASLSDYFHISHVGERIVEKQDRSTMTIEGPPTLTNKNIYVYFSCYFWPLLYIIK